jgi:hypothetical protein
LPCVGTHYLVLLHCVEGTFIFELQIGKNLCQLWLAALLLKNFFWRLFILSKFIIFIVCL